MLKIIIPVEAVSFSSLSADGGEQKFAISEQILGGPLNQFIQETHLSPGDYIEIQLNEVEAE